MKKRDQSWIEAIRTGTPPTAGEILGELMGTIPLINQLAETPQDPEWHAEGHVRTHVEWVVEEARKLIFSGEPLDGSEKVALIMGAALHDIGKTLTTREEIIEGAIRIISPRHAEEGRSHVAPWLGCLALSDREREWILGLIGYHHDPRWLVLRSAGENLYRRLARRVPLRLVYLLERCDLLGRECRDQDEQLEILDLFKLEAEAMGCWEKLDPYWQWKEQIAALVLDEKQRRYVTAAAIEDFEQGVIQFPEEAVARTWEHRANHARVTLLCGPSGSGKSSWIERHSEEGAVVISLDQIREEFTGRASDQSKNGQVMQIAKERLRESLRRRRDIYWDSTALRRDGRAMVVGLARRYHAASRVILLPVPPETALERNRKRTNSVPQKLVEKQFSRWQWPEVSEAWEIQTHWYWSLK